MKKPLLETLLCELQDQLQLVEPHSDANIDCAAHANAMTLLTYLIQHAKGQADLRLVCAAYFKGKLAIPEENYTEEGGR